jgi:hypothetical protein
MSVCTAKRSNGVACKGQAITGARVCRVHGGSAPQVIAAARRRLLLLIDPALGVLAQAVRVRSRANAKKWDPSAQEIAAAREVLNRAGLIAVAPLDPSRSADASLGQVLWEEFIQIHRRVVAGAEPATQK